MTYSSNIRVENYTNTKTGVWCVKLVLLGWTYMSLTHHILKLNLVINFGYWCDVLFCGRCINSFVLYLIHSLVKLSVKSSLFWLVPLHYTIYFSDIKNKFYNLELITPSFKYFFWFYSNMAKRYFLWDITRKIILNIFIQNANRPSRFFHHPTNFDLLSPPRYEKRQSYFDSLAGQSLGKRSGPNTFRIPFREAGYRSSPDKSYEYFPNLFQ